MFEQKILGDYRLDPTRSNQSNKGGQ
jgi:hypothetical protein